MTGGPADSDETGPSRADVRMAELLAGAGHARDFNDAVREARAEDGPESADLLQRLNALDYLDSLVGEVGGGLPERLGDFRLVGLLGRGGMGTVFEAFQESLERYVAVKVLTPTLTSDPRMRRRFRTEARASATLHHQHIVPVYGFGEAQGLLYFAMERVEGVSLDRHIDRARRAGRPAMTPREAAQRFAGVADALHHAHRRGVLHRDVKPGNILVHPDGELALADFGLSKIAGEHSASLSRSDGFLGTLHYAAPEQAMGRGPGPRSDLYALGATIYECVTGRLPIEADSTEGLLHGIVHGDPPPLRRLVPGAPRDLEAVLQRLLAKEPDDRYADGETLARDLQRVADDEPITLRRVPWSRRFGRWVRKHPDLSAALGAAALLLATTGLLFTLLRVEERQGRLARRDNLVQEAVVAVETDPGAVGGPGGLLSVLVGVDLPADAAVPAVTERLAEAAELRPGDRAPARLRSALQTDPAPAATAALRRGDGYAALREVDSRIAEFEAASGFAQRDAETWLVLYRLYVTRAMAKLTAVVGDLDGAGDDLLRASMMRPGAFLPRLLGEYLAWDVERGVDELVRRVDAVVDDGPPRAAEAAAWLQLVCAGRGRPPAAALARFDLPSDVRRELHATALRRLAAAGVEPEELREGRGEFERVLAGEAGRMLDAWASGVQPSAAVDRYERLLDEQVAPTSRLRAWYEVFARLRDPGGAPAEDGRGRRLTPELRLAGIELLLRLQPPSWVVAQLREQTEALFAGAGAALASADAAVRVRALLAALLDPADVALPAAETWVAVDAFDAAAYVCRFHCHLQAGAWDAAEFDAVLAQQNAAEPDAVRRRLRRALLRLEPLDERMPVAALERLREVLRVPG